MLKTFTADARTQFLMAIVAALLISISLTATAAVAGLLSAAPVQPESPPLLLPLADQLQAASELSAASAAVLYAPDGMQDALVPAHAGMQVALAGSKAER